MIGLLILTGPLSRRIEATKAAGRRAPGASLRNCSEEQRGVSGLGAPGRWREHLPGSPHHARSFSHAGSGLTTAWLAAALHSQRRGSHRRIACPALRDQRLSQSFPSPTHRGPSSPHPHSELGVGERKDQSIGQVVGARRVACISSSPLWGDAFYRRRFEAQKGLTSCTKNSYPRMGPKPAFFPLCPTAGLVNCRGSLGVLVFRLGSEGRDAVDRVESTVCISAWRGGWLRKAWHRQLCRW